MSIKRIFEKIVEGLLMISSGITSLIVLLIVIFLFREGFSLFNTTPLENHNVIVVNKANPVSNLNALEIKDIFDQKITNWNAVGGKKDSIIIFSINDFSNYFSEEEVGAEFEYLPEKLNSLVDSIPNLLAVFNEKYLAKDFPFF